MKRRENKEGISTYQASRPAVCRVSAGLAHREEERSCDRARVKPSMYFGPSFFRFSLSLYFDS